MQAADHRDPQSIQTTWQNLLESIFKEAEARDEAKPYEFIAQKVLEMGQRLELSETTFDVGILLNVLESHAFTYERGVGDPNWVIDIFFELGIPDEVIASRLVEILEAGSLPFTGSNRKIIADHIIYVVQRWFNDTVRTGHIFGSTDQADTVLYWLEGLQQLGVLDQPRLQAVQELIASIEHLMR